MGKNRSSDCLFIILEKLRMIYLYPFKIYDMITIDHYHYHKTELNETEIPMNIQGFDQFNLQPELTKALAFLGYYNPTRIQQLVIPPALRGKDLWVRSQTGSGKTAAFGIPICEQLQWLPNHPQALVLVPTRELALQVAEELGNIGRLKRLKVLPIFGKVSIAGQELALKQMTHIVVGTPGRGRDVIQKGPLVVDDM